MRTAWECRSICCCARRSSLARVPSFATKRQAARRSERTSIPNLVPRVAATAARALEVGQDHAVGRRRAARQPLEVAPAPQMARPPEAARSLDAAWTPNAARPPNMARTPSVARTSTQARLQARARARAQTLALALALVPRVQQAVVAPAGCARQAEPMQEVLLHTQVPMRAQPHGQSAACARQPRPPPAARKHGPKPSV